jgi:pimeloyl-ACP methyl ester carboxylesterase
VTALATAGDIRIVYELRGEGPPLLLVHGLGYARWGWEPVVDGLAERFHVCLFDNRGIGESDVPDGPYTARAMAEDVAAVLDAAGFERAHVVGTSLGGMVAQELALARPERVEALVLACTTPGLRGFPMPEQTVRLLTSAASLPLEEALRRFVENALAPDADPALVERIVERRLANPFDMAGWQAQAAAGLTFDALDRLPEIRARTLLLHGTQDLVVDHRNSELLAERIPGARLELFEGCGHLFMWEQPERFVSSVADFLAEVGL